MECNFFFKYIEIIPYILLVSDNPKYYYNPIVSKTEKNI